MMKRYLALTVATLLSAAAAAQDPTPAPAPTQQSGSPFDALDADKSGTVNQQEAQAHPTVAQHFAEADADANGALTRSEFDAKFTSGTSQPQPEPQAPTQPQ